MADTTRYVNSNTKGISSNASASLREEKFEFHKSSLVYINQIINNITAAPFAVEICIIYRLKEPSKKSLEQFFGKELNLLRKDDIEKLSIVIAFNHLVWNPFNLRGLRQEHKEIEKSRLVEFENLDIERWIAANVSEEINRQSKSGELLPTKEALMLADQIAATIAANVIMTLLLPDTANSSIQ